MRRYIADALGRMGNVHSLDAMKDNALQSLMTLLQDPDELTRFIAAISIINISPNLIVAPIFNAALMNDEPMKGTKVEAVLSLMKLGAAAVVPTLIQALKSNDVNLRLQTAFAFQRIGPAGKEALPALQPAAEQGPDERVRKTVFVAVHRVSGNWRPTRPQQLFPQPASSPCMRSAPRS